MYAIYARQSVEKKDSISIEMQIDLCRAKLPAGEEAEVYADRGFTGTNMNRPAFKTMLGDINSGRIRGVLVYKLDRISRSLSDFARLSDEFSRKGVALISCSEQLDSTTPMGMMLVRILIMFAEMEQKTIAERLRDNYHARAVMKLPLGGLPPYGYTEGHQPNKDSVAVREIYTLFLGGLSMDRIARVLTDKGVTSPRGKHWSGQQIGRILRNPAYVCGDGTVSRYFTQNGVELIHPVEEYDRGCGYILMHSGSKTYLGAGDWNGIIPAEIWLTAQDILLSKKPSSNGGSGNKSWLQGLVLCGKCGANCYVRSSGKGMPYVYFVCRGRRNGSCAGLRALRTEPIERLAAEAINFEIKRLSEQFRSVQRDRELERLISKSGVEHSVMPKTRMKRVPTFNALSFADKKAAARLLIKNIIINECEAVLILR